MEVDTNDFLWPTTDSYLWKTNSKQGALYILFLTPEESSKVGIAKFVLHIKEAEA